LYHADYSNSEWRGNCYVQTTSSVSRKVWNVLIAITSDLKLIQRLPLWLLVVNSKYVLNNAFGILPRWREINFMQNFGGKPLRKLPLVRCLRWVLG
jgi:hypothetical protein